MRFSGSGRFWRTEVERGVRFEKPVRKPALPARGPLHQNGIGLLSAEEGYDVIDRNDAE